MANNLVDDVDRTCDSLELCELDFTHPLKITLRPALQKLCYSSYIFYAPIRLYNSYRS